ncbi:UDP-glucose 4-epimerase GalE [bacterium]|nr:UDP-glucose 4-epimerase GalE [bacterium]
MKVLVTGGAGYIGSHAVKLLLEKGHSVVVIDNLYRGYKQPIETLQNKFDKKNLKFYQTDLTDGKKLKEIFKKEKPAGVMHFAALCLVNESMEKPERYFENNVCGSLNLFKAMIETKSNYLIFSSTCAVYGESQYLPVDENHPLSPTNPYGESKLMVEKILFWLGKIHQLRYVILRYFNVSGAASDGLIGDSKKPSQLLVQNAVRGALGIEPFRLTCPTVNTPDGTPIRDYINVEDLVEAHLKALDYLQKGKKSEIFNLGTGKGNSVLEVVKTVQKVTGVQFPIKKGETRKGEYAKIYADISKAKKLLNWQPKRTLKDSIKALVKWYRSHPHGWEY